MKCMGKKKDGGSCRSGAESGFFTCIIHRNQEPSLAGQPSNPVAGTFISDSSNYRFVIQGRKTQKIDGQIVETQPEISADFSGGRFSTTDPVIAGALREYIAKNPNSRLLFEV